MLTVLAGAMGGLWGTRQTDRLLSSVVEKDLVLYQISQEMELALANQKGYLTYYFVDGNVKWLKSLGEYRKMFQQRFDQARSFDLNSQQKAVLDRIGENYGVYIETKDVAIEKYSSGKGGPGAISDLHEKQRDVFFTLLGLCREFHQQQWDLIKEAEAASLKRSARLRTLMYLLIPAFAAFCLLLLYVLYAQILGPIRTLAIETGGTVQDSAKDEVVSLRHSLEGMMKDITETHDELTRSRQNLIQVERMAMIGELAAGVAHTIRNPFTSIKMRMFSLSRSLNLTSVQNEDLQVISNEIERIDGVVKNFIEFARPPKLKITQTDPDELLGAVAVLMKYRLEKYDAVLTWEVADGMKKIPADAEQMKEALLNLLTNSCQAMEFGGRITIRVDQIRDRELGEAAVISVKDTGPGIPEHAIDKITTPFFTTKEEGSGLGLSIVSRIIREHDGRLVISHPSQGAEFIIILPLHREKAYGTHIDH